MVIMISLLLTLILLLVEPSLTESRLKQGLRNDRNTSHVQIRYMTPHTELHANDLLNLRCVVTIQDESEINVDFIFMEGANDDDETSQPKVTAIARGGALVADSEGGRLDYRVRKSWDTVVEVDVQEHYLTIEPLKQKDQGFYACQISLPPSRDVVASKHSLIAVLPQEPNHVIPTLQTQALTTGEDTEHSQVEKVTLGPITERFLVVTRGTTVILECRDSDSNWVYWKKQGDPDFKGTGKTLRLFRVDRWDSGLYYCSTNTSFETNRHNITLSVEQAPKVMVQPKNDNKMVAKQALGHKAILTCRVEAVPVPQISWYKIEDSDTTSVPLVTDKQKTEPRRKTKLHPGDHFSISISGFKDGLVVSELTITSVRRQEYGEYECKASNNYGQDHDLVRLEFSETPVAFGEISFAIKTAFNFRISIICLILYYYI